MNTPIASDQLASLGARRPDDQHRPPPDRHRGAETLGAPEIRAKRRCRSAAKVFWSPLKLFSENDMARDLAAVRAALSLPWSTGPVEGEISRLKTIKRTMCGRVGFELLR
jgi:transposase